MEALAPFRHAENGREKTGKTGLKVIPPKRDEAPIPCRPNPDNPSLAQDFQMVSNAPTGGPDGGKGLGCDFFGLRELLDHPEAAGIGQGIKQKVKLNAMGLRMIDRDHGD